MAGRNQRTANRMETLAQIYSRHAVGGDGVDLGHGDKGSTHSYIEEYERLLAPYRKKCVFMEIGLASGKSVCMWDEYFGKECQLFGVDLNISFDTSGLPSWRLIAANAAKPSFGELVSALGVKFDVVIDDASHMSDDQVMTREIMRPFMAPGSIYIIEDILNLEATRHLWQGAEILDLRGKKGRFDDVLVIYRQ